MHGFVSTSQQVETQLHANLHQKDRYLEHITAYCQNVVKASPYFEPAMKVPFLTLGDVIEASSFKKETKWTKPNLKWKQMPFQLT